MTLATALPTFGLVAGPLLLLALACNGNVASSNHFPFTGPSCSGSNGTSDGCWSCTEANCAPGCVTNDCSDYFNCLCPCAQNDSACLTGCQSKLSPACTSCLNDVASCAEQSCQSACNATSSGSSGGSGSSSGIGGTSSAYCDLISSGIEICTGIQGVSSSQAAGFTSQCTQSGGKIVSSCPTASSLGCCTIAGSVGVSAMSCSYCPSVETASALQMACAQGMGTYVAGSLTTCGDGG
jgi:hypothetical protein